MRFFRRLRHIFTRSVPESAFPGKHEYVLVPDRDLRARRVMGRRWVGELLGSGHEQVLLAMDESYEWFDVWRVARAPDDVVESQRQLDRVSAQIDAQSARGKRVLVTHPNVLDSFLKGS